MPETNENWIKRVGRGNRLYWILAILALPISALLAYSVFPIGCRCSYGAATMEVFETGIYLIGIRLLIGLMFGENKKKTLIYMVMPFVVGIVVSILGPVMGAHSH